MANKNQPTTITVAVCTWNRAALLDQTLAQMRNMEIPSGAEWELLVLNNNCTDNTDETIARQIRPSPSDSRSRGIYSICSDDPINVT